MVTLAPIPAAIFAALMPTIPPPRNTTDNAGSDLDQHAVTGGHQLLRTRGNERDAIFVRFDFFGNADFHGRNRSSYKGGGAEHCKLTSTIAVFNRRLSSREA